MGERDRHNKSERPQFHQLICRKPVNTAFPITKMLNFSRHHKSSEISRNQCWTLSFHHTILIATLSSCRKRIWLKLCKSTFWVLAIDTYMEARSLVTIQALEGLGIHFIQLHDVSRPLMRFPLWAVESDRLLQIVFQDIEVRLLLWIFTKGPTSIPSFSLFLPKELRKRWEKYHSLNTRVVGSVNFLREVNLSSPGTNG